MSFTKTLQDKIFERADRYARIDFDGIETWGRELSALLQDILPKDVSAIFAAEPPEDMEHARAVLLPHLGTTLQGLLTRMTFWVQAKEVVCYFPIRLREDEVVGVWERGIKLDNGLHRADQIRDKLSTHPGFRDVQFDLRETVSKVFRSEHRFRVPRFYLSASRNCLVRYFDAYPNEYDVFDERVARSLLGDSGAAFVRGWGDRYLLKVRNRGRMALSEAKRWAKSRDPAPNFVRDLLDAWAYWLADPQFAPAEECLDIGFDWRGSIDAKEILQIERIPDGDQGDSAVCVAA